MTPQSAQDKREQRAEAAFQEQIYEVRVLEWPFKFILSYQTQAGVKVAYKVANRTEAGYCDCPSWPGATRQHDTCKHVKYIRKWIAKREEDEARLEKLFGDGEPTSQPVNDPTRLWPSYQKRFSLALALETKLTAQQLSDRLGDLVNLCEIVTNTVGYGLENAAWPLLIRARVLTDSERMAILKALEVTPCDPSA